MFGCERAALSNTTGRLTLDLQTAAPRYDKGDESEEDDGGGADGQGGYAERASGGFVRPVLVADRGLSGFFIGHGVLNAPTHLPFAINGDDRVASPAPVRRVAVAQRSAGLRSRGSWRRARRFEASARRRSRRSLILWSEAVGDADTQIAAGKGGDVLEEGHMFARFLVCQVPCLGE
jgi:hypothetical protein